MEKLLKLILIIIGIVIVFKVVNALLPLLIVGLGIYFLYRLISNKSDSEVEVVD